MARYLLIFAILLGPNAYATAGAIPFKDYILLKAGMSEGEILLRVGPPDYVSNTGDFHLYQKTWFYLPDGNYSGDRLTELTFDVRGKVIWIERKNPFTRYRP